MDILDFQCILVLNSDFHQVQKNGQGKGLCMVAKFVKRQRHTKQILCVNN
jgi:hypothetical protein